jgi:hypothetical protein
MIKKLLTKAVKRGIKHFPKAFSRADGYACFAAAARRVGLVENAAVAALNAALKEIVDDVNLPDALRKLAARAKFTPK